MNSYQEHVRKHLRGARNPRQAMREAAHLWNNGATQANPGTGDTVTKVAIAGLVLYLGWSWWQSQQPQAPPIAPGQGIS